MRFHQLDYSLSLKDNLKDKTIIEFPTIYVVLKHHKDAFDVLGSGETCYQTVKLKLTFLYPAITPCICVGGIMVKFHAFCDYMYEGGLILKVQLFVIYGLHATTS
jgi:hypothetical protein